MFTDIEGSTRLLERVGEDRFASCLTVHDTIIRDAVENRGGVVVRTTGDGFFTVFTDPHSAVEAAVAAQRALQTYEWPPEADVRVRMGLHTGRGVIGFGEDYVGLDVHRAARISDAGHGGQIVISSATAALFSSGGSGLSLLDLGTHRLRDLGGAERLYQVDAAGLEVEFPALRTVDTRRGNLPTQLTTFVGRSTEVSSAKNLLATARLVTLTGPGGTGKTRLALQLATEVADSFADGAYFVPLDSMTDAGLVPSEILDVLGSRAIRTTAPAEQLVAHLAGKRLLLILDNLEQIVDVASVVAMILAGAPDVKVVATSRTPLRIRGEQELEVPPLAVPPAGTVIELEDLARFDAVRLFTDRARTVRPDFELTEANVAPVATLAANLDGLPLAIELAASRIKLLTPAAIVERLDNRLLSTSAPDLPRRQQTIANAIGWSYDLLDEPARRIFERCSVFVGGASLRDIETICGPPDELGAEVLDALATLVDHSLVGRIDGTGQPRFRMLTMVREFAAGALRDRGEEVEMRRRHAVAYANLAERAAPNLLTSRQRSWLGRLVADHDNLRAAIDWATDAGEADLALGLAGNLWRFWQTQGHLKEASERIESALALPGGSPVSRAKALEASGGVKYWRGDWRGASLPYEESLRIMREHGTAADVANALYNVSFVAGYSGDRERAIRDLEEALALFASAEDHHGIGLAYWGMCDQVSYAEDWDAVCDFALRAVEEFEKVDAPFDLAWAWFMLADAYYHKNEPERAAAYLSRALPFFLETRDVSAFTIVLYLQAATSALQGDELRAARILGAADALTFRSGAGLALATVNQRPELNGLREDPRSEIREAREEGGAMSFEGAVAFVLEQDAG